MIDTELKQYIEEQILPMYDKHDAAHRRDHADMVISQSLRLAENYEVDKNMVYTIAAYHDTGIIHGREHHHTESKRILLSDKQLRRWFTKEQISIMGEAVEDHRASSKHAPRTIYGCIVAEADRVIIPESIIRRTIQFTLNNHPELDKEEGYKRLVQHLKEKYDYGGYLKLWIKESENTQRLEQLRQIIANKELLRSIYEHIYTEEITQ
ncbi:MAG: HD domain-containing protein [Alistipes sp.]|nr:HD domain-containing protein [Alistipes sp.]